MYYPYFRGKQFDLLAIRELIENDLLSEKIQPIIEPVKQNAAFRNLLSLKHPIHVIQNPQAGAYLTEAGQEALQQLPQATARIVDQPIELLTTQPEFLIVHHTEQALQSDWSNNQAKVLVPQEFRLLNKVQGARILSEDVFTRLPKAAFYGELPDEVFSTAHLTYRQRGFVGFSDFSIDNRIYYEHGYPSSRLMLHLVYLEDHIMRIHHFLSAEEGTQQEKFFELMAEVTEWLPRLSGEHLTRGLAILLENVKQEKFPGMGIMRKAAVMHHLELMNRLLKDF